MNRELEEVERNLADLKAQARDLQQHRHPRNPDDIASYYREPWAQALSALPGTYYSTLASLELLLSSVCHSLDPEGYARDFAASIQERSKPGYWSKGAVARGLADVAVKLGVLQPEERDELLSRRAWDDPTFRIDEVRKQLDASITILENITGRLKDRLS